MDFEDSGIDSDPKINNDTDTLKQNNEPIISFSPERCRFDSLGSNFRKPSTSSFSVTDLEVGDPPKTEPLHNRTISSSSSSSSSTSNANNSSAITNLKNSSLTTSTVPTTTHSITQGGYLPSLITHHHQASPNSHPFLHNDTPQLPTNSPCSYSVSTPLSDSLVINTYSAATLNSTAASSGSKPSVLPTTTTTCVDSSNSISLMINGSVLSANSSSTTNSTLDLQKRLERRIAQASAAVSVATSSNPIQATGKTKANDPILSSILSVSSIDTETANSNASTTTSSIITDSKAENQITFSPRNSSIRSSQKSAFQQKLPASLWESGSSASDIELLWESKLSSSKQTEDSSSSSSKVIPDSFMESPKESQVSPLQSGIHGKPFVEGKENENWKDERREMGKPSLISDGTRNDPPTTNPTATALENIGSAADDTFVACSNNNAITSITTNVNKGCSSESKSRASLRNNNAMNMTSVLPPSAATSTSSTVVVVNSGFDIRKVAALLPPQRLAIPCKPNPHSTASNAKTTCARVSSNINATNGSETTNVAFSARSSNPTGTNVSSTTLPSVPNVHKTSNRKTSVSETSCNMRDGNGDAIIVSSGNGNVRSGSNSSKLSSEKKPLVQWDSDESEEELSFFPPSKRGVITDNLSIDNMSLSGEEEDLHLTPPRPLAKRCPCDPRTWLDRRELSSSHHQHGDSIRNIVSKPCVIS